MPELGGPYRAGPEGFGPGKLAVFAAIGAGVGFGTCGLSVMGANNTNKLGVLVNLGAGLFFLSLLALLVALIWAIVRGVRGQ